MPDGQMPSPDPAPTPAAQTPAQQAAALTEGFGADAAASGEAGGGKGAPKPGLLSRFLPWRRPARGTGLGGVLEEGGGTGLSDAERQMIERIVAFDTKRVDDVAIPRADIVGVEASVDLPTLLRAFSEAGHSRLPVYRADLDDPLGMIHIKDVVGLLAEPERGEGAGDAGTGGEAEGGFAEGLVRKTLYVPPSMPITDLLLRMQAERVHMALVIDEYGGTDGLVTIEDLIEEIVGDIRDEHDDADDLVLRRTESGRLDVDARIELGELKERTGLDLGLPDEEADTLGGVVFLLSGRVPVRGEVIRHPAGYELEVAEGDARRIRRLFLRPRRKRAKRKAPEEAPGAAPAASGASVDPAAS